jgi:hypothetical protein
VPLPAAPPSRCVPHCLAPADTPFGVNIFVPPPEHYHPQPLSPDESEAVALWVAAYQRRAAALGMATKVAAAPSLPDFHGQWSSFERHVEVRTHSGAALGRTFECGMPSWPPAALCGVEAERISSAGRTRAQNGVRQPVEELAVCSCRQVIRGSWSHSANPACGKSI